MKQALISLCLCVLLCPGGTAFAYDGDISWDNTALDFGVLRDGAELTRTITVRNNGQGVVSGEITAIGENGAPLSWLKVTPKHFKGREGNFEITISLLPDGLSLGMNEGWLVIGDEKEDEVAGQIPLRAVLAGGGFTEGEVKYAPGVVVSPAQLDFGNVSGKRVKMFNITGEGGGILDVKLRPVASPGSSKGVPWLKVNPNVLQVTEFEVKVTVNAASMKRGTSEAYIHISDERNGKSSYLKVTAMK